MVSDPLPAAPSVYWDPPMFSNHRQLWFAAPSVLFMLIASLVCLSERMTHLSQVVSESDGKLVYFYLLADRTYFI
jgi:hypothetical protein